MEVSILKILGTCELPFGSGTCCHNFFTAWSYWPRRLAVSVFRSDEREKAVDSFSEGSLGRKEAHDEITIRGEFVEVTWMN